MAVLTGVLRQDVGLVLAQGIGSVMAGQAGGDRGLGVVKGCDWRPGRCRVAAFAEV